MPVNMKALIAETLASMVKRNGIDKVTVKALIDACGISRQTFYYHFQDMMEVIEWSVEQANQSMVARSLAAETPEEAAGLLISSAGENRALIRKMLSSQRREQIERLFVQAVRTYLQAMIRGKAGDAPIANFSDMEVALDLWSFGIAGLMFKCTEAESVDVEKLSRQICSVLSGSLLSRKSEKSDE